MICSVRSAICQAANAAATATVPATAHQGTGRFLPSLPLPTFPLASLALLVPLVSLALLVPLVPLALRKVGQVAGSWRTAK